MLSSLDQILCAKHLGAPVHKRLGEILIERGKLDAAGLERALRLQESGDKVGVLLVSLGTVAQRDVSEALALQLGLPLIEAKAPPDSLAGVMACDKERFNRFFTLCSTRASISRLRRSKRGLYRSRTQTRTSTKQYGLPRRPLYPPIRSFCIRRFRATALSRFRAFRERRPVVLTVQV